MKVLDLQCAFGHVFEGWFGSEADYVAQSQNLLVQCPVCGDPTVSKKLSAPRLALSKSRIEPKKDHCDSATVAPNSNELLAVETWLAVARQLLAETTDVGSQFAEEARRIHYGETESRGIRGTATVDESNALAEEGIEVVSFPLPIVSKEQLQ